MNIPQLLRDANARTVVALMLLAAVAFTIAWAAVSWNPAEEAPGQVARGLGIVHKDCEKGWKEDSVDGEHVKALTCIRVISDDEARTFAEARGIEVITSGRLEGTEWVVILNEDGTFSHAYPLDTAGAEFIYAEDQVPGWLD